jgi:hypothetical protein
MADDTCGAFVQLAYDTRGARLDARGYALNQFVALAQDTRGTAQQRTAGALDSFVDLAYQTAQQRRQRGDDSECDVDDETVSATEEMESEEPVQESGDDTDSEDEEEEDLVERVDSATMRELQRFQRHDLAIALCGRRRFSQIFARPHSVQWWYGAEFALRAVGRLNSEPYMRALRRQLWLAHEQLLLFGFCGFFVERDMAQWFQAQDWQSELLPFCVIEEPGEHGHFRRRRRAGQMRRALEFRCDRRAWRERYDCWVYEECARFEPLTKRQAEASETDEAARLTPLSPFFALYTEKLRVLETSVNQFDANAQATHPEHVVNTKLLEEPPLEDLPRDFTYALDDLDRGKQIAATKRQNVAVASATAHLKRVTGGDDSDDEDARDPWAAYLDDEGDEQRDAQNPFKQRLSEFGRPSLVHMLTKPLPPSMQIQRGPAPHILVRAEELQRVYESNVCNLMDCSPALLRPHGSDAGKAEDGFQQTADAQLRATFEFLFSELYGRTFGRLDAELFGQAPPQLAPFLGGVTARLKFEADCRRCQKWVESAGFVKHGALFCSPECARQHRTELRTNT